MGVDGTALAPGTGNGCAEGSGAALGFFGRLPLGFFTFSSGYTNKQKIVFKF